MSQSLRSLAMAGALSRACALVNRGWMDSAIRERLQDVWPGYPPAYYHQLIDLAREGVAFARNYVRVPAGTPIDWSQAPQFPQE